jgi:DNA-directed RNA polymerase beta' subunit
MGAEGIKKLLEEMDLDVEIDKIRNDMTGSELKIKKNSKRLKVLEAFKKSASSPSGWSWRCCRCCRRTCVRWCRWTAAASPRPT